MVPARYLYLVDETTEELLRIYSLDAFTRELEIISFEAAVRAEHRVDDQDSGLALRDSAVRPLPEALLRRAWRRLPGALALIFFWGVLAHSAAQLVGSI